MKYIDLSMLITASMVLLTGYANAGNICDAIALRDIHAIESEDSVIKKGKVLDSITQYRVNKKTNEATFCQKGGYCYPAKINYKGKFIETLKLTNCKIGKKLNVDDEEVFYSVDVIRSKNTSKNIRYDDITNKLNNMGLCSACADNAAQYYIHKPKSKCAQLVKQSFEGNPDATKTLLSEPDYCVYKY